MSALADYVEERLLNWLFNSGAANQPTQPPDTEVSLHTGDPGEDGSANEVPGTSWTNYARQTVNNDGVTSPFWRAAVADGVGHLVDNNGVIDFGSATVTGADVQVSHFVVWDKTNGNPLFVDSLGSSKTVQDTSPVKFEDGELNLKLE